MLISELITTVRNDYLYDVLFPYLWSDESLLRYFTEAERQACSRANLIYDDTTTAYTRITLVAGQASYALSPKITVVENILFNGAYITKKTKEDMDVLSPSWRSDTGMTGNTVYAVISGRQLRVSPVPNAADAGSYLYLETYRLPALAITDSSQEPEIPAENHRDLIWWVLHECYKKRDAEAYNPEQSEYYLFQFNQIFGNPVSALVRQHQFESPRSLTISAASYFKNAIDTDEDW